VREAHKIRAAAQQIHLAVMMFCPSRNSGGHINFSLKKPAITSSKPYLGIQKHLATLDELEYLVPKNRSTIREHLDRLTEKQLMTKYTYRGDEAGQHDPREFWGSPPMVSPS